MPLGTGWRSTSRVRPYVLNLTPTSLRNLQGIFAHLIFTGQFKDAHKLHHNEVLTNLTKSQVRTLCVWREMIDSRPQGLRRP
jgi:hypothetical protein